MAHGWVLLTLTQRGFGLHCTVNQLIKILIQIITSLMVEQMKTMPLLGVISGMMLILAIDIHSL